MSAMESTASERVEQQAAHLELLSTQLREQGDVRQVLLDDRGVSDDAPTLADELWLIQFNLRAIVDDLRHTPDRKEGQ